MKNRDLHLDESLLIETVWNGNRNEKAENVYNNNSFG